MLRSTQLPRILLLVAIVVALAGTSWATAQQPKTIRSTDPWKGVVVPDDLSVYSGRADVFDRIGNLEQGQIVTVREVNSFGWCSIAPPPGFYAFVAERDVELDPSGDQGRTIGRTSLKYPVNDDPLQSWRICKVEENTEVVILETRETARGVFFKVAMPETVDVYVNGQFIRRATEAEIAAWEERLRLEKLAENTEATEEAGDNELAAADDAQSDPAATEPVADTAAAPEIPPIEATPIEDDLTQNAPDDATPQDDQGAVEPGFDDSIPPATESADPADDAIDPAGEDDPLTDLDDTQPTDSEIADDGSPIEDTPVSIAHAEESGELVEGEMEPIFSDSLNFDTLEILYEEIKREPVLEAEIQPLLGAYLHLSEDEAVDDFTRRRARARVVLLEIRLDYQLAKRRISQALDEADRHGEAEEEARVARTGRIEVNGILKGSSIYDGVRLPALYRIVDEITGQTDCYVRPVEGLILSDFADQRVHVVGKVGSGPGRLIEVITPTKVERLEYSLPMGVR